MRKVFFPEYEMHVARMFQIYGFQKVPYIDDADLICFTGGADVSPEYYHHARHPKTFTDIDRDAREKAVFDIAKDNGTPMVGICRGGQFLNVMNGGKMFQHVTGHGVAAGHMAEIEGQILRVSSTHHQMMKPHPSGNVIGIGVDTESRKIIYNPENQRWITSEPGEEVDYEVVVYGNHLCFQPHPEFGVHSPDYEPHMDLFIDLVKTYCFS